MVLVRVEIGKKNKQGSKNSKKEIKANSKGGGKSSLPSLCVFFSWLHVGGMNSFFSQCDIVKISFKLALQARRRNTQVPEAYSEVNTVRIPAVALLTPSPETSSPPLVHH